MGLRYKTRKRLSLLALVVGLPLYIVAAVVAVNMLEDRFGMMPWWGALIVYVALGFLWALPLKPIFTGVGQPDPDAPQSPPEN